MAQVQALPRAPQGARVPPHNLEAEESVLGSMLLSRTAVGEALEIVRPEDFYREAHAAICEVIRDLFGQGEPTDAVIVSEELRRRGTLADVGGLPYVHTLVSMVPTAANAAFYAQIVAEHATLRRLIEAATQIAGESYDVPEDVEAMVNRAEELILSVAARRGAQDFKPIRELLAESMEHIEMLASRQADVTGLPTGFRDLDELLSGMQPGNLLLVAARPAMGKSSFAINVAQHVSQREGRAAVLFSLEMSWMEIVQRLICSEARVDTSSIRKGKMGEAEWRRVSHAVGQLAEAPLFIDDTPSITMGEIIAKCRRLKNKHDLGLVVVDYLQLMTSPRRTENRVQEVSEISRSLKILAKQLELPVLAVSQLSRQPEQGGGSGKPRRPRLADLRECVTSDTLVVLADGRRVPIAGLVGSEPTVIAVSPEGRIVEAKSDAVWKVGKRPVFRVELASGRRITATGRHRLLGARGWSRVDEIAVGDRIATARRLPEPVYPERWPDDQLVLLAHLIGDGSYLTHQPIRYTTASEQNSRAVREAAERAFGARVTHEGRGAWHQLVLAGNGNRWRPAGVGAWLRMCGIWNQRSADKCVPADVFRLDAHQISLFLRHLWATDGTINMRRDGSRGAIAFDSASRGLVDDVAALLLRLGIRSRICPARRNGRVTHYHLVVSGVEQQRRFLQRVGAFGPRADPAAALARQLEGRSGNTNVDTLPVDIFERVRATMRLRGISTRRMATLRGTAYGGESHFSFAPSRSTVADYAEFLDDDELRARATDDLFWDAVTAIEPAGIEEVYDLTVPGPASWLADGIVSHNSGALEQDADVVMFVFREEYYDEETERKGEADIIVEKHRNGPTGTIPLAFLGQYTRFDNLARM